MGSLFLSYSPPLRPERAPLEETPDIFFRLEQRGAPHYTGSMIRNLFGRDGAARSYRCCICDRETEYWGPTPSVYPFCSPRCKLVDLGKWLREQYSIDGDLWPDDLTRGPTPGT